jgi:hypothetical protein
MNPETQKMLRAAEDAVSQLVEHCSKAGPLYHNSPKTVAQVSRTGKWLINAVAALRGELERASEQ